MHQLHRCAFLPLRRFLRTPTTTKRTLHSSTTSNSPAVAPSLCKVDVIAHRGASGRMPDHTLETYKAAFETGADWIELDAHSTLDGELVVNHDIELAETTDIEEWAWADTYRTRTIAPCFDGETHVMEGYMVSDFTLEQLKKLRVKMRHVERSQEFNLQFQIPTVLEGDWKPERLVVIESPSRDNAKEFLADPEAQALFAIRQRSTTSRMLLVDGS